MTDYLMLTEFVPGTKAKAQEINANFSAVKDAINLKASTDGDNTKTFSVANATLSEHAVNKTQLDNAASIINTKIAGLINRFCLKSGNLTAGEADLLDFAGTTLSFKIGTSYPSVLWTSANGTQETIASLANITGLSTNGTYSIVKELGATNAISTSSAVSLGKTFPASPADGDYHCLSATELKTYKRVSGAWVETQYVPIGTVTVAGGVIASVATKPYNQIEPDLNTQNFTQNLSENGYTKLPNGLIIQWGTASIGGYATSMVTFPIAFPNNSLAVFTTQTASSGQLYAGAVPSKSTSSFNLYNQTSATQVFYWFAIGY